MGEFQKSISFVFFDLTKAYVHHVPTDYKHDNQTTTVWKYLLSICVGCTPELLESHVGAYIQLWKDHDGVCNSNNGIISVYLPVLPMLYIDGMNWFPIHSNSDVLGPLRDTILMIINDIDIYGLQGLSTISMEHMSVPPLHLIGNIDNVLSDVVISKKKATYVIQYHTWCLYRDTLDGFMYIDHFDGTVTISCIPPIDVDCGRRL